MKDYHAHRATGRCVPRGGFHQDFELVRWKSHALAVDIQGDLALHRELCAQRVPLRRIKRFSHQAQLRAQARARGSKVRTDAVTYLRGDLARRKVTNGVDNAESAERVTLVRKALERLDSTDRKLLLMMLVEGLKPGAIAARLGLKVELVRQRNSG